MLTLRPTGSARKNLKKEQEAMFAWFDATPYYGHKAMFLGWKHRAENPFISVKLPSTRPGSVPEIVMVPRSVWDEDPTKTFPNVMVMALKAHFSRHVDRGYMFNLSVDSPKGDPEDTTNAMAEMVFTEYIRKVHVSTLKSVTADEFAAEYMRRQRYPDNLVIFVRLIGLVGAAHLNGCEGVLKGPARSSSDSKRFTVHLEDGSGKNVDVKRQNYELLPRPRLVNREFE